ncbi:MAG TPA: hypothetical protein VFP66_13085 [Candidatus Limnocylindrales bacterium]|nr:hypothetical protein [Candidatus Limnocylindrales bacterium]
MNERSDIDRVLRQWFDDGPSRMPERVVDVVADRIARERQRPAWRLDWRHLGMNTTFKLATAVAAVAIVAVFGYNLLPRGSSGIGELAPTPSPTASPTASPTSTPPWDAPRPGPCGERGCGGPLTAGTYTSKSLNPAVTYTLTADWVNLRDWPDFFQLYPDTPENRMLAAAAQYPPHILILPATMVSPSAACAGESPSSDETEVDAARFVEFLTTRENLAATGPVPVTVGGLTGQQIDASLEPGWTGCLPGAPLGESLTQRDRIRYIVLDTPDGGSLMIRLRAPTDFDAFVAEAMPIVESFEFDLGPTPS